MLSATSLRPLCRANVDVRSHLARMPCSRPPHRASAAAARLGLLAPPPRRAGRVEVHDPRRRLRPRRRDEPVRRARLRAARRGLPRRSSPTTTRAPRSAKLDRRADGARAAAVARGSATFTGARERAGAQTLTPARDLHGARRRARPRRRCSARAASVLGTFTAPLQVARRRRRGHAAGTRANGVRDGAYRGALEFAPGAVGGVNAINALGARGLRARRRRRGVARRRGRPRRSRRRPSPRAPTRSRRARPAPASTSTPTRARRSTAASPAETPSTDAAVAATRGQVVTYDGKPVVTYFFSTSGGRTENVENSFARHRAASRGCVSVDDPYDNVSPRHRWGPDPDDRSRSARRKLGGAGARARSAASGSRSAARRRGSSRRRRRHARAARGHRRDAARALRALDTWAYFNQMSTNVAPAPTTTATPADAGPGPDDDRRRHRAAGARVVAEGARGAARARVTQARRTAGSRCSAGWATRGSTSCRRRSAGRPYAARVALAGLVPGGLGRGPGADGLRRVDPLERAADEARDARRVANQIRVCEAQDDIAGELESVRRRAVVLKRGRVRCASQLSTSTTSRASGHRKSTVRPPTDCCVSGAGSPKRRQRRRNRSS